MNGMSLLPPSQRMTSASCSARSRIARVVDAGEDEVALGDVGLVLLALLDGRVGRVEVLVALEALDRLLRQVAVGHRVAQHGDALARSAQQRGDVARRLALAGARAHGADGDDRLRRAQHRVGAAQIRRKSAPAASAREPMCITCSCVTSE